MTAPTDPRAARLAALDARLAHLAARVHETRGAFDAALAAWRALFEERRLLVLAMQAGHAARAAATGRAAASEAAAPPHPAGTPPTAGAMPTAGAAPTAAATPAAAASGTSAAASGTSAADGAPGAAAAWPPPPGPVRLGRPDASPRTVQNLLFILGGVLLGVAAIVFTAVAWATYGNVAREAILGAATAIAFAAPILAVRRKLVATAETVAAVALLLFGLDGYGAWALDFAGLAHTVSRSTYAGIVMAAVAAVSLGYGRLVRLTGPRFVGLIAAQGVLPLLLVGHRQPLSVWVGLFAVTAAADALVALGHRPGRAASATTAPRVLAGIFGLGWLMVGMIVGFRAMWATDRVGEAVGTAAAFAACALVLGVASRNAPPEPRAAGVAIATVEIAVAATRVGIVSTPVAPLLVASAVLLATVGAARSLRPAARLARGTVVGAWASTAILGLATLLPLVYAVSEHIEHGLRLWHTDLAGYSGQATALPGTPLAVLALAVAVAALTPRAARFAVAAAAVVPLSVAVAELPRAPWWAAAAESGLGTLVLAGAAVVAIRRRRARTVTVAAIGAGVLAAYAVAYGLVRPVTTAAVTGGVVLAGLALTRLGRRIAPVAGGSFAAALLALPGFAAGLAGVAGAGPVAVLRAAAVAVVVGLVGLVAARKVWRLRRYGVPAVAVTAYAVAAVAVVFEHSGLYVLGALLVVVLAPAVAGIVTRHRALLAASAGIPLAIGGLGVVLPLVARLFAGPYAWLDHVWSGAPRGVGLTPSGVHFVVSDVIALALAGAVAVAIAPLVKDRAAAVRSIPAAVLPAVLAALVVAGAPWPAVPVVSLLGGAVAVVAAGRAPGGHGWIAGARGLVALGAGMAALLPTKPSTLLGLGALVVVAAVVASTGRTPVRRTLAGIATVGSADALAYASVRAADDSLATVALALLAVAALALLSGAALRRRGPVESLGLEAAAHATAFVAFVIGGSPARAALVAALWGVLVGVRALGTGLSAGQRRTLVSVGAGLELLGWWLLAVSRGVHLVDAYTLPLAGVALLAGWLAGRDRALSSWAMYGPALMAAFLPSLAPVLADGGSPLRRIVIGAGALAVVLLGARARLQAPVIVGGAALLALALHEIALVWRYLPSWLPLTVAGLLVLAYAVTYERRRRDWSRLRSTLGRMV